jgi:hypothetical protein
MRTKEEIYKAHHTYAEFGLLTSKELTLKSMDEYAKEVAIAFAKWKRERNMLLRDEAGQMPIIKFSKFETDEELFNQFIKETTTA